MSVYLNRALDFALPRNPVTQNRELHFIPTFVEKALGESLYSTHLWRSGGALESSHKYVQLVQEVGQQLAAQSPRKDLKFEFNVVNSKQDNAWCLPGGKIAINQGLIAHMAKNATEHTLKQRLAAVLSHEITHATARHTGRAMEFRILMAAVVMVASYAINYLIQQYYNKQAQNEPKKAEQLRADCNKNTQNVSYVFNKASSWIVSGIGLCKSRSHELEADKYGMHLMKKSGFDPAAAVWLQEYFKQHHSHKTGMSWFDIAMNFLSSHPSPEERIAANQKTLEELNRA
jgi:predicted Zn-dependent protease